MNQPTPAIVSQNAVRSFPRWALLLLCVAYIVPGYVGRAPWKSEDIAAFGYMQALAQGATDWLQPRLVGFAPETDGLLSYWLGAWALQWAPGWLAPEMAARAPFILLLTAIFACTWYGTYYLARSTGAQPVAFAFGGEARPKDYARAIADGALLALISCLGLALFSHETTSHLTQLGCTAVMFFGIAALPYRPCTAGWAIAIALPGLALSGAPAIAMLLGVGGCVLLGLQPAQHRSKWLWVLGLACLTTATAALTSFLDLWRWRFADIRLDLNYWQTMGRLFVWFGWPAWPMALWTLWRWRKQIAQRQVNAHLLPPLWFLLVPVFAALCIQPADRVLLLCLPALAALAAFALPTFSRSMAALIDWFTLLFFSVCAIAIWVIWIAMQTGVPAQPAANVAKLAPGFIPEFSPLAFAVALLTTLAWCRLVWWRAARNRTQIWKSLVLPASGATLSWLLLMTLWLPLLDYARSFEPQVRNITAKLGKQAGCVQVSALSRPQLAALRHHGKLDLHPAALTSGCPWLLTTPKAWAQASGTIAKETWSPVATVQRPTSKVEGILVLRKNQPISPL